MPAVLPAPLLTTRGSPGISAATSQFSHYDYFDDLMDDLLGVDGWLYHQRESWVWLLDRFVPYPFQLNLHRLPDAERASCVRGLITALRGAADKPAPENFGQWIDAAFGPGIGDVFLRPYNWKVWAHSLDQLSWGWIGDRVALVDLARIVENIRENRDDVSWGPNNQFRFPKHGGTGSIWCALHKRLAAAAATRMQFGRRLSSVDTARRIASFTDGSTIRYEQLLTTMPLDRLVAATDLGAGAPAGRRRSAIVGHARGGCGRARPRTGRSSRQVLDVFSRRRLSVLPGHALLSLFAVQRPRHSHAVVADGGSVGVAGKAGGRRARGGRHHRRHGEHAADPDRSAVHHTWHRRLPRGYPRRRSAAIARSRRCCPRSRRTASTAAAASARGSTRCRIRITVSRRASSASIIC